MKSLHSRLKLLLLILLTSSGTFAQSPTLQFTGTNLTLTQGTINSEVLSAVIQVKQQEVKEQIFQNSIVKSFQRGKVTKNLNNFATYHYMYRLMDDLTSGKNKTAITTDIVESSAEFSYAFGLAMLVELEAKSTTDNSSILRKVANIMDSVAVSYGNGKITTSENVIYFNLLLDMCYDVILRSGNNYQFDFSDKLADSSFMRWYNTDNVYIQQLSADSASAFIPKADLQTLYQTVSNEYNQLMTFVQSLSGLTTVLTELKTSDVKQEIKLAAENLLSDLVAMDTAAIRIQLEDFISRYSLEISPIQLRAFTHLDLNWFRNYQGLEPIVSFFQGLTRSIVEKFSMTQSQYEGMTFILNDFLDLSKNQFKNDVVSIILEYVMDNSFVSTVNSAVTTGNGYLYMDVEALIEALYARFLEKNGNKGFRVYIKPLFTMGVNYAHFLNENTLASTETTSSSLANLYFASEKVGFKWKIWNWAYTHSFDAGQHFSYYGKDRYLLTPPTNPLVSDIHVIGYASGLLYNLVNLKSNRNFSEAIAGGGLGLTFFNGLSMNVSIAMPISNRQFHLDNMFVNVGFDIPIVEYLSAIGNN